MARNDQLEEPVREEGMRTARRLSICVVAVLLVGGVVFASPAAASTVSRTMRCTAVYSAGYQVYADVSVTIHGVYNSARTRITFTSTSWSYTNARKVDPLGTYRQPIDARSNLNLISPLAWNSPDSFGASGSFNTPDFSVARGTTVRVRGIPDVRNFPDPMCTASTTVSW